MRIYTKGGDKGTTGIFGGSRVDKDDIRIETNGTLDELNATLGVIRALLDEKDERQEILAYIQRTLMIVMSQVATPSNIREQNQNILPEDIDRYCEQQIDRMNSEMQYPSTHFILPGGTLISAQCHVALHNRPPGRKKIVYPKQDRRGTPAYPAIRESPLGPTVHHGPLGNGPARCRRREMESVSFTKKESMNSVRLVRLESKI